MSLYTLYSFYSALYDEQEIWRPACRRRRAALSRRPVALGLAARAHAAPLSYPRRSQSPLCTSGTTRCVGHLLTSSEVRGRGSEGRQAEAPPVTPHQMHRRSLRDYKDGKAAISMCPCHRLAARLISLISLISRCSPPRR